MNSERVTGGVHVNIRTEGTLQMNVIGVFRFTRASLMVFQTNGGEEPWYDFFETTYESQAFVVFQLFGRFARRWPL